MHSLRNVEILILTSFLFNLDIQIRNLVSWYSLLLSIECILLGEMFE